MVSRRAATVLSTLNSFVSDHAVRVARAIMASLIAETPVDTGWARSNWIATIGQAHTGTVGSKSSVNDNPQRASIRALDSYRTTQGEIFVANNVPYLVRLNEGSSAQAPAGFVQAAITRAEAEIR